MARIPPLEPPFTVDITTQLAAMMPPGMPPIARGVHLMVFADRAGRATRVELEPGAARFAEVTP